MNLHCASILLINSLMELLDFMTKGGHKVPPSGPLRVKLFCDDKYTEGERRNLAKYVL